MRSLVDRWLCEVLVVRQLISTGYLDFDKYDICAFDDKSISYWHGTAVVLLGVSLSESMFSLKTVSHIWRHRLQRNLMQLQF